MSAREVEITCSSKGLREILVDGEELDCSAIRDKLIPDWFKPARDDRSGWRGLIKEIKSMLADDGAELHFAFYGRPEQEHQFFNCLDEYGMDSGEKATAEEVSEARIHDAQKAALRGQSTTMLKNLMVAAELGSAEAMRSIAICYRDGVGVDPDYETASEWLRKAAKAGDKQALEMLLQPMGEHEASTMPTNDEPSSTRSETETTSAENPTIETVYVGIDDTDTPSASDGEQDKPEYEKLKNLMDDKRYEDAWPIAHKFAERGDAYAQMSLGFCYMVRDTEDDYKQGVTWTQKAAEQGLAEAQNHLGDCYYYGIGVAEDNYSAFHWYQKAAEQGNAEAQRQLGICYQSGQGTNQDDVKAVEWLQKAAEQGDVEAKNYLGVRYALGDGVPQDGAKAFTLCREAAEQGLTVAQNNLAYYYQNGIGVQADAVKAFEWYRKSAEQGNADAQNSLGDCYCFAIGVDEDKNTAFQWYQKAAGQDNAEGQNMLGRCYLEGWGVQPNEVQAFEYFTKAAEQELAVAQNNLAYCYDNGIGVQENVAKAFELYGDAAEQGYADAQCAYGIDYALGCGTKKDLNKAEHWLKLAVEQEDVAAHYWLAEVMYAQNVRDELSYNSFYAALKKRIGDTGITTATTVAAGLAGWFAFPAAVVAVPGYLGYNALKSMDEKNKAKAFLQTKAGKEMLSLYEYAAENGMEVALEKLVKLQKYL